MTPAGARPRVILVHGAIERSSGFAHLVTHLADYDVTTYDRKGHGARWQEGPASLDTDISELVGLLDDGAATVVGHSMGGLVALGAALRCPERIDSIGLYETAIPWAEWWTDEERAAMMTQIDRNLAAAHETESADRGRLEVAWASCRDEVLEAFAGPFRWQDAAVRVVTARGGASDGYSARDAELVAAHYGVAALVLEGSGHRAHRTDPGLFAGFVADCVPR